MVRLSWSVCVSSAGVAFGASASSLGAFYEISSFVGPDGVLSYRSTHKRGDLNKFGQPIVVIESRNIFSAMAITEQYHNSLLLFSGE